MKTKSQLHHWKKYNKEFLENKIAKLKEEGRALTDKDAIKYNRKRIKMWKEIYSYHFEA